MKILDKIKDSLPFGDEWDQFSELLMLDDSKFDIMYKTLRKPMEESFEGDNFQNELLAQVHKMPRGLNVEEELSSFEEFLDEIKAEEELSENKKELLLLILNSFIRPLYNLYQLPRKQVTVQIEKLNENAIIPSYAHPTDCGCDVCSIEDVSLNPGETKVIKTGLKVAIPIGYEIQVRPRSGLSLKTNLRVANAPGTIDSNYRGEVGVIITNIGNTIETITKGEKIAQLVVAETPMIKWNETTIDDNTDRGSGGFGSTDKQS